MSSTDEMLQLETEVRACQNCALADTRKNAVPGEGPVNAKIMLIGEGPGFHENEQGRPFVGAAGKFLEELLGAIELGRDDVYITNVVKCRPPGNRDPEPDEIEACQRYLDRQIQLINPRVIVTLGRISMARWFPGAKISAIHGQPKRVGTRMVVPMFHPAAALHQPKYRPQIVEDFKKLPGFIEKLESEADNSAPAEPPMEQMSLF